MSLTPELVDRVPPAPPSEGQLTGRSDLPTEDDWNDVADMLLAQAPSDGRIRIFAYGSLIWKPGFEFDQHELGTARGWRRAFCLGWVRIYRGTSDRPGIMLSLDRGGACRGVVFSLPEGAERENLLHVIRREMPLKWTVISVRWMKIETADGPVHAIGFPTSRRSPTYLPGLDNDTIVQALATAAGQRGSMAEYLRSTIEHLEARGIHDRYLWRLQEQVAERIAQVWT